MGVPLGFTVPTPQADGVYPYVIPVQPGLPPAEQTNLIGLVGVANWGPENSPVFFNTLAQAGYLFGYDAAIPSQTANNSIVGAVQESAPEGTSFCAIRVDDGSGAAATGKIVDTSSATIASLAAAYHGTDGNSITVTVALYSGSYTSSPVVTVSVAITNRQTWVSLPFSAGASTYTVATFLANLQAALAGTAGGPPCPYVVYVSSGSSSIAPASAANVFTGGSSGVASITSAVLIGTPGVGTSTGMYALQNTGVNLFHICGLTDMTQASTMATFAQQNSCMALLSFPAGTSTTTAISSRSTNNANSPWLVLCNDFIQYNDVIDQSTSAAVGTTNLQYITPATKIAAGISELSPYQYPGNKPYIGFQNMVATIRTSVPYSNAELGQLEQNGILIITNPIPRGNVFGMAHGMSSDGLTPISDTRMLNLIANELTEILGAFVGETQTPPPAAGQTDQDITRNNARNAVAAYLGFLANPNAPQIASWAQIMDGTNNTQATVAAGYLFDKIEVTTLAGIRFILLGLQIGQNVQITTPGNQ